MVSKGDMVYAWTTSPDIAEVAECGGAVTGLLKFALENDIVDGVLAVKEGVDLYDAIPTLITDPADYAACNAEYVKHFPNGLPARHTARFGVPTEARVAFSCIALAGRDA